MTTTKKGYCMNCGKPQARLVSRCSKCIDKDVKKTVAKGEGWKRR